MKEFIKKNWKIILIVCLGLALYFSVSASIQNRKKYLREKNNTEALLTDIEHERTQHGEDVATIHELQLTVKELKKLREEDVKMIEELKIRPPQIKEIVKFYKADNLEKLLLANGLEKLQDMSMEAASEVIKRIKQKLEEKKNGTN